MALKYMNVVSVKKNGFNNLKTNKIIEQEEIKMWIDKWSKLKPTPQRNMVIKIWSKLIKNK
jgi:hypothetical protein